MGTILLMGAGLQTTVTGPTYDPDAQAFFNAETAAGVTLTTTQKDAVNQWVVDAKAAGIWTKFKAVYPMVGGTATAHKFNLKNPADTNAAFRLNFVGGWTHSSNGATPNGTNAYADTYLSPSTQLNLTSTHLSYHSRTDVNLTQVEIGSQSVFAYTIIEARTANASYFLVNTNSIGGVTDTNSAAFYIANRTASNVNNGFRNNIKIFNSSYNADALPVSNIYIGALNNLAGSAQYYSSKQCAFASIGDGLTDLESQVFYQITEKYQVALGRNINATQSFYYNSAYNNETNAFLFSTQITDNTIQTATNTLVNDLKTANIWTKMKAIYPMVGGTATTHKFNLVNAQDTDAAFRLNFVGGWTHSSTGALPNGTNAYADSFLTTSVIGLNSGHLSYYSRTNSIILGEEMGALQSLPNSYTDLVINYSGFGATFRYNDNGAGTGTANANTQGFYIGSRTASNVIKLFKNGTSIQSLSSVSNSTSSRSIYIGAINNQGTAQYFTNRQCAFASIGAGLTDAEALAFFNAVNAFQISLARNV